jgi:hypothetical protein
LLHIIPKKEEDWRPSMTLIDIIQQIPAFITEQIKASKDSLGLTHMVGKYHLGLQYDMSTWPQSQSCGIFPCQEEKEAAGGTKRKGYIDVFTVVTESILLYLEPDHKIKNVARLIAWFTLPTLEQIKRNMDSPNSISFIWRRLEDASDQHQLEFKLQMQNSQDCIAMVVKHLKAMGITVNKGYEKKRKILESEVTSESATKGINIADLHAIISQQEAVLAAEPTRGTVDSLMELYNKAIVYYSALSDEKHLEYL